MDVHNKRILGLDMGESRIGVALSDPLGIMASPLTIISRTDELSDIAALVDIIQKNDVGLIIVGLPLSMDGSSGPQVDKVKAFVTQLCYHTDVPVVFQDERLSTVLARRIIKNVRKTSKKTRYDAAAAALILQGYLDDMVQMNDQR
jgi:putative Holliday junction resolvase